MKYPIDYPAWQQLTADFHHTQHLHLRQWFADDPQRAQRYWIEAGAITLDYSKNRINDTIMQHLIALAHEANIPQKIKDMFTGKVINPTENRAALHTALRRGSDHALWVNHENITPKIHAVLRQMGDFTRAIHCQQWRGFTGRPIGDIVNIGIGGSDLGPKMMCNALKDFRQPDIRVHFASNIDGAQLNDILETLNPETTLFIIASKTFSTQETIANAHFARAWFLQSGTESDIAKHFVAVSTNRAAVAEFGIDPAHMFEFWDWVGGRFSLWSAIGLPIMVSVGEAHFLDMLEGAYAMDQHFAQAPMAQNMPVILALLGIWYIHFYGSHQHLIAPYSHRLRDLPAFLQQLDMESNGKSTQIDGSPTPTATAPVVWGEAGTNSQHAFFQMLHQGTHFMPIDFIASLHESGGTREHHAMLLANMFAQSEAFMRGKTIDEARAQLRAKKLPEERVNALAPHTTFAGNRPSNTLLLSRLNPHSMGSLIALYEHKIFVQGSIWGINSFDQWGVELGKQLAHTILSELHGTSTHAHDSSTTRLIERYRAAHTS